ncbi:membrane protein [Roseivirga seohaensis subsp. aquiponti]|uniref:Membrane protein n=1 Tax=Roseivirga seohaensis subsp. aquiponti TaxID=1566026 RepID=A0A0L8AH54_9BACT|nr:flotillin family protein [Roseivirga seohaensis]KOF01562.1 membrane protein [Roseivirga seohaensis subsp. aquiponti]
MSETFIILIAVVTVFIFVMLIGLFKRYKRCPSDRILVVYGRVGNNAGTDTGRSAKCIHGGAAFVWPVIQDYAFLDLTPISIEVNLTNALSRQNIRVDVPSRFTVGISTEEGVMTNAAERLLGLSQQNIHDLAKDIIFGQLRLVVATMDIEEINSNRDKFLANVASNVEAELKKIGLKLINVNVTDIKDESGYIEALGKEAAAKAINDARQSVAEKNRDGLIGEANAHQDQRTQVAAAVAQAKIGEANAQKNERIEIANAEALAKMGEADAQKDERIKIADANARAVEGENTSRIIIAKSDAERRSEQAEAERLAIAAEKVKEAKALEEAYKAQKEAENARAERDRSTQNANIVIPAEIGKKKIEIDAEAEAENVRRRAKGEADAIFLKMDAEARGIYEILSKQAEGFKQLVQAAGDDSKDAVMIMIADKLPELVRLQTEAIKNIKIDKVTVWDNGGGNGPETKGSTANFISGLYKSVPPLQEMFNMAGMQLPEYLKGKNVDEIQEMAEEIKAKGETEEESN